MTKPSAFPEILANAKKLADNIFPRGECDDCGHQWQPREPLKKEGSFYYCANCKKKNTKVWNRQKRQITDHWIPKTAQKRNEPYKKDGKWYNSDGTLMPDLFTETDRIEDEIDKSILKGSHIKRGGIESFPEFDTKTVILVYAKAIEAGYEENQLHEFMIGLLKWHDVSQRLKSLTGKIIDPDTFPSEFEALIGMALEARQLRNEVKRLEERIEKFEQARELLNVELSEEMSENIGNLPSVDESLAELTNFGGG